MIFIGLSYITELIDIKTRTKITFSLNPPANLSIKNISLLRMDKIHIYSFGHANREDLLQIIQMIKPETIIPIHTENPKEFRKLLKNENYRVILPEEGAITKL